MSLIKKKQGGITEGSTVSNIITAEIMMVIITWEIMMIITGQIMVIITAWGNHDDDYHRGNHDDCKEEKGNKTGSRMKGQ